MADRFVVDTHALVWFLENSPKLSQPAKAVLADPAVELVVPAIVLAEACWMANRGRTKHLNATDLFNAVTGDRRVSVDAIELATVKLVSNVIAIKDIHDLMVVSCALQRIAKGEAIIVITADDNIRGSGLVPVLW